MNCWTKNTNSTPIMLLSVRGVIIEDYLILHYDISYILFAYMYIIYAWAGGSVIGSKPPTCLNKCMNCKPCMATLVVPNNQKRIKGRILESFRGDQDDDDTYYLLTWKCQCGNKLFQPWFNIIHSNTICHKLLFLYIFMNQERYAWLRTGEVKNCFLLCITIKKLSFLFKFNYICLNFFFICDFLLQFSSLIELENSFWVAHVVQLDPFTNKFSHPLVN